MQNRVMVAKSIIGLYGNNVGVNQTIPNISDEQKSQFGLGDKSKTFRHNSTNAIGDADNDQNRSKLTGEKQMTMDDVSNFYNTLGYFNMAKNQISSTIED